MKNKKRIFAWMLCLALLGTAAPLRVNAEDAQQSGEEIVLLEETNSEPAVEAEPEAEPEPEVKAEPEAKPEPEVKAEPEAKPEPEVKREPETKPEPEAKPEPEKKDEPEAKDEPEVKDESEAKDESEDEPETKDETEAEDESETEDKSEAEDDAETGNDGEAEDKQEETPQPAATETPAPEATAMPKPEETPALEEEEQTEAIRWAKLRLEMDGDTAKLVIGVQNADGARLDPFAVKIGGDVSAWRVDALETDGASLTWDGGDLILSVENGVAQGGRVVCGGKTLELTLGRSGGEETELTLAALDENGDDLKLKDGGGIQTRLKLEAKAKDEAPAEKKPTEVETALISNGDAGLTYGDTLEMTAVVKTNPEDAAWSIRWQYSVDGEHFEEIEGANGTHYAVTLDAVNAQYYWRFVVTIED